MDEAAYHEVSATANASFALSQMTFWHLVKTGLLPKADAEKMLQEAIAASQKGGPALQLSAGRLMDVLQHIRAYKPPKQH